MHREDIARIRREGAAWCEGHSPELGHGAGCPRHGQAKSCSIPLAMDIVVADLFWVRVGVAAEGVLSVAEAGLGVRVDDGFGWQASNALPTDESTS